MYDGYTLANPCFSAIPPCCDIDRRCAVHSADTHSTANPSSGKSCARYRGNSCRDALSSPHARCPPAPRFIRMAALAVHLHYLVRMRIFLDRRVAVVALHAAVNAVGKRLAIHGDAVTVRILHALVAVAGQAIGLRISLPGPTPGQQRAKAAAQNPLLASAFTRRPTPRGKER